MTPYPLNQKGEDLSLVVSRSPAPDMDSARLHVILDEIISQYQELMRILQEEKRLIINGDVEDLVCCLAKKEEVVRGLQALEERRQEEIALMSPQDPNISLQALIHRVPPENQGPLRSSQAHLDALSASIQDINQMNGILVERVLQQITSLLGLLKQMAFNTVTYQPTGLICESPSGGKIIAKG